MWKTLVEKWKSAAPYGTQKRNRARTEPIAF